MTRARLVALANTPRAAMFTQTRGETDYALMACAPAHGRGARRIPQLPREGPGSTPRAFGGGGSSRRTAPLMAPHPHPRDAST